MNGVPTPQGVKVERDGPERIFLEPSCCVDWIGTGRQWCEHDVWGDDCEDHSPPVEYVRADLARTNQVAELAWQPIETAPIDVGVLLFSPDASGRGTMVGAFILGHDGGYWADDVDGEIIDAWPTHWMPLPPAPAGAA